MTYQGALPSANGFPGQGDAYGGGPTNAGGPGGQPPGYMYQQQQQQQQPQQQHGQGRPQVHHHQQFGQSNGSQYYQNGMYGSATGQAQFYHGQYAQQQQQPPQAPQSRHGFQPLPQPQQRPQQQPQQQQQQFQHQQHNQSSQMRQYGASRASAVDNMYNGSFRPEFSQHIQHQQQPQQQQQQRQTQNHNQHQHHLQPEPRQFVQTNDAWRQSQSPSIQHNTVSSPMQTTVMQHQHSQQQHLQQLQQMQHSQQRQHSSPQLYKNSIDSPQMNNQLRSSPRPQQTSIPAQHLQEYQRRISQSPISQPSPLPRQIAPRQSPLTPQLHQQSLPSPSYGQMAHQQQPSPLPLPLPLPQQQRQQHVYQHIQSPLMQTSPYMRQSPQLQQSPHIVSQQQARILHSPTPPTQAKQSASAQAQVQSHPKMPLQGHQQPQQNLHTKTRPFDAILSQPEPEPEPEPESEKGPESGPLLDQQNHKNTSDLQASARDDHQIEQQLQNDQLQGEQFRFVNLQDIQNIPPPPPPPPLPPMNLQSIDPRDLSLGLIKGPVPDPLQIKRESDQDTAMPNAPAPKLEPKVEVKKEARAEHLAPHVKTSPRSSVSNSPSVARSPSITKRSPAIQHKQRLFNTVPIMAAAAEECIGKARSRAHDVAMFLDPEDVAEYQRLISTGLTCFEAMLHNTRLAPREEARVRLRYATILHEETDNIMEAETALTKGIALCDKHRLMDLKYCMQYSMLKLLFQRNHKAALKAVDGHISNCETFKHVPWYYAFRLLKATFHMEVENASDTAALENIRAIQNVASTRGDNALSVFASVLEGLVLLKTAKEGNIEKVQGCIAHAAKFQFDDAIRITQLDVLTLLLDFAASLHHQNPDVTSTKLRELQRKIDNCEDWNNVKSDFMVPIKKQAVSSNIVGKDTASIVNPGDGTSESDFLVVSFMTKMELRSLVFTLSGLSSLHKPSSKSADFWLEGSKILETWDESTTGIPYGPPVSLHTAIKQRQWRTEGQAYIAIMLGLLSATRCQWASVKGYMDKVKGLLSEESQPMLKLLALYLSGVYHQGLGELRTALNIFQSDALTSPLGRSHGLKVGEQEVALLAGLNRLWIMQHETCRQDQATVDLIEQLQPACGGHWNAEVRTAWHNVMAALVTDPPQQLNQQKQHIQAAMGGSKVTNNIVAAAVTLCIMRSRFFENVVGDQALKSARAAAKQAQRSGNVLWQSVADGMLAHSYDVQGQREESRREWEKATEEARDAFKRE